MAIVKTLIVKGVARFLTDAYMSTIRSGIWNGSTIQVGYGGTGVTSAKGNTETPVFLASNGITPCSYKIPHATKAFKINGVTFDVFTNSTGTAPTIFAPTALAGTGGYILATNSAKTGLEWVAANSHTHSQYVLLDSGTNEQVIKSSISSLSDGIISLWRATEGGYPMIGFHSGTTKTKWGMLGFSAANTPIFRNTSNTGYLLAHAGNIVNDNITVALNTEKTIATIAGVAIKLKVTGTNNVTTSAVVASSASGTTLITAAQANPYYNLLEGGAVTRSIQFTSSNITISSTTAGAISFTAKAWSGATDSADGTAGYMPGATSANRGKYLRGDGTWVALAPSISRVTDSNGNNTNEIKITVGGENSSAFTVPYATSASSATQLSSYRINNSNTSNTWIRIATITIPGTNLASAGFTAIFSNRERLDNTSFILTLAIRRNNTTNAADVSFYYTRLQGSSPRTLSVRSDNNQTFYVYFQSAANSYTTYYNVTRVMTEGDVKYENVLLTNPIQGTKTLKNAVKGGDDNHYHAVSTTASGTAAKVCNASWFALRTHCTFTLYLQNANTVKGAITLNVNSTGAKPVYINGSASSSSNYTLPAGSYFVYYNGTNYYLRTDAYITTNITGTASKWTTARTLTIGNTGKEVDGSANVAWSLSEIGAVAKVGDTMTGPLTFQLPQSLSASSITNPGINFGNIGHIGASTGIGIYTTGNIWLRPNLTITNNSFSANAGMEITSTTLKYNSNLVAHAGNISNKDATIGTSSTTIATIAGVDITAKVNLSNLATPIEVTKTLNVDSWENVGAFTGTGTYAIQISSGNLYASGILSGCGGNDTAIEEVPLHVANKDANTPAGDWRPYVRINGGQMQMTTNEASPGTERTYTIKILKLI